MYTTVDDSSFKDEINNSNIFIIVNFWAPWCIPCQMVVPIWDKIAQKYSQYLKVLNINTDTNPTTAMEYHIRSIPTTLIIKQGKLINKITGAIPQSTILQLVEELL
uniref:thioredoxin n=1 Tax=Stylonema alsidii TaxID=35155 RepID=UPI001FCCE0E1|nr:thioredoxin [Stylonema alsidii]UNJ15101.1 thioredoxin [Stylonema alsidii]